MNPRFTLSAIIALSVLSLALAQTIVRVNAASPCATACDLDGGDCDGSNWDKACQSLAEAVLEVNLVAGAPPDHYEIWVVQGTYKQPGTDRNKSFLMHKNVTWYGGFDGTESSVPDWDTRTDNETILSGDIGTPGVATDNCYHVVRGRITHGAEFNDPPLDETAIIDGFTISDGQADGGAST